MDRATLRKMVIAALSGPPFPVMERARLRSLGYRIVETGDPGWPDFSAADWWPDSFLAVKGSEAAIVLIHAREPGRGAFSRLLASLSRRSLTPAVVCPLPDMEAILRHKGFVETAREDMGDGLPVDVWRPAPPPPTPTERGLT